MSTGSKTQKVTQETKLDPQTQALNSIMLDLQHDMGPLRKQVLDTMTNPGARIPRAQGSAGLDMTKIALPNEQMAEAFGLLIDMADTRKLEEESTRIFNEVVLPGIMNKSTASGFGRSGAQGETLRKAGVDMTLPILGMEREGSANIINALMNLEQAKMAPLLGMMGAAIPFTPAPTMTGRTSQSGSSFDFTSLIPMAGAAIGSYFGGPMGGMAGGQAGGMVQGAMGGGSGGAWNQPNRFSIMG